MAARQTLTLFVGVQIPHPQPKNPTRKSWIFLFVCAGHNSIFENSLFVQKLWVFVQNKAALCR